MQIILGFSTTDSWISKIIRKKMKANFSHTFLIIRDNVYEADFNGIVKYPASKFGSKVVHRMVFGVPESRGFEILGYAEKQIGKRYSYFTLLQILLGLKDIDDGNHSFICSEFVARCLKQELNIETDKLDMITPKQVYNLAIKAQKEGRCL